MDDKPYTEDHFLTPGIDKSANEDPNEALNNLEPFATHRPTEPANIPTIPVTGNSVTLSPMDEAIITDGPAVVAPPYNAPDDYVRKETSAVNASIPAQSFKPMAAAPEMPATVELLDAYERDRFSARWGEIQGKFVDEPRDAVQQADLLVSDVIAKITEMFDKEHTSLESQWNQGSEVNTEDLRKVLQRYRTFFHRLVD